MILFLIITCLASAGAAWLMRQYFEHSIELCPRCHEYVEHRELIDGGGYCFTCNDDLWQEHLADMADPEGNHVAFTDAF